MTHVNQEKWCRDLKVKYPKCFKNVRVLDVGSLDINGNNRHYFDDSDYIGLDVIAGKNVDVVCPCHKYNPDETFDVVISTNALEHDMFKNQTMKRIYDLAKPMGWIFISAACGFPEHGTRTSSPEQSGTSSIEGWTDYYENVSWQDYRNGFSIPPDKGQRSSTDQFLFYEIQESKRDIRFTGKKR